MTQHVSSIALQLQGRGRGGVEGQNEEAWIMQTDLLVVLEQKEAIPSSVSH